MTLCALGAGHDLYDHDVIIETEDGGHDTVLAYGGPSDLALISPWVEEMIGAGG